MTLLLGRQRDTALAYDNGVRHGPSVLFISQVLIGGLSSFEKMSNQLTDQNRVDLRSNF